jgi:cytochrome c
LTPELHDDRMGKSARGIAGHQDGDDALMETPIDTPTDSMLFNKIAGALLSALLFVVVLNLLADGIFAPVKPAKPGFAVAVAAPEASSAAAAPKDTPVAPIADRMKTASEEAGAKVFGNCKACHNAADGGPNQTGPNLYNVVGGPAAHMATFTYSDAMSARGKSGAKWTYEDLDKFLTNPKAYVPGTKMGFAGLQKPEDRANVIMYLRDQSKNPMPMPN